MLFRSLVVVGLVGFASLTAHTAVAEDAKSFAPHYAALDGVSFADPATEHQLTFTEHTTPQLDIAMSQDHRAPFAQFGPSAERGDDNAQRYEIALGAQRGAYGLPVDVTFAQHASIGMNAEGDLNHRGRGSELRLGRGLFHNHHRRRSTWDQPTIYAFAASDDEALTWAPSAAGRSAGFALQDRIEIGDMQAGFTYEAGPFQASLAYVQRKVSATTGATTVYRDENFAGVTLTLTH